MDKVLVYLSILYKGNWDKIYNHILEKKEVDKKLDKLSKQAGEMKKTAEGKLKKHSSASEKAVNDKIPDSSKYKPSFKSSLNCRPIRRPLASMPPFCLIM